MYCTGEQRKRGDGHNHIEGSKFAGKGSATASGAQNQKLTFPGKKKSNENFKLSGLQIRSKDNKISCQTEVEKIEHFSEGDRNQLVEPPQEQETSSSTARIRSEMLETKPGSFDPKAHLLALIVLHLAGDRISHRPSCSDEKKSAPLFHPPAGCLSQHREKGSGTSESLNPHKPKARSDARHWLGPRPRAKSAHAAGRRLTDRPERGRRRKENGRPGRP
jgi:hypothetical protein